MELYNVKYYKCLYRIEPVPRNALDCEGFFINLIFCLFLIKHSIFMSNHKIIFFGAIGSTTESHTLSLYANASDEIFITIDCGINQLADFITLDKETAIKLSRVLKAEISKLP